MNLNRQQEKIATALDRAGRRGLTTWELAMECHILNPGKRVSEIRRLLGRESIISEREADTAEGDQVWRYYWGLTTAHGGGSVQMFLTTEQKESDNADMVCGQNEAA